MRYYPFGMLMPGRHWGAKSRYGFNGKEMDNEVSGEGNQYDYGFRIYDPRGVRFKSVDPLFRSYPWFTPYQFAGNTPIKFVDLDGLEAAPNRKDYAIYSDSYNPEVWTDGGFNDSRDEKEYCTMVDTEIELPTLWLVGASILEGFINVFGQATAIFSRTHMDERNGGKMTPKQLDESYPCAEESLTDLGTEAFMNWTGGKVIGLAFKGLKVGASFLLTKAASNSDDVIRLIKVDYKFSDDVKGLVDGSAIRETSLNRKIKEVITFTKSGTLQDAIKIAKSKVGNNTNAYLGEVGPNSGKVVGFGDKTSHWRLDWSEDLGVHINWQNSSEKGAIPINMTKETYERAVDKLTQNFGK